VAVLVDRLLELGSCADVIVHVDESCSELSTKTAVSCRRGRREPRQILILRSTELSNAKRQEPLPGAPAVDVLPPATRHGVPGAVICSEGYRRLQELDGKRRETMIYTGSARWKVTPPYVESGVDSILRPALFARYVVAVSSVGYV